MSNVSNKTYVIKFDEGAFDSHNDAQNISHTVKNYTKEVKEMNAQIDELDRFDDFDSLRISPEKYEMKDGEYGIPKNKTHGDSVIFKHQEQAALKFIRDLRGFGILADVVGSGKTFEAGVVISELAARNKVRSLLFIVPTQVYADWIDVMENKFGMGKGTLYQAGPNLDKDEINIERIGDYDVPRRPIIVTVDDFVQWSDSCFNLLFDVVCVDEAHHLCAEEGKYSYAMKNLCQLIELKKKAKSSYCLLLSATPHSGNLEKMFRLWYFVRCTGGNPDDYDIKEDGERTRNYQEEKKYYLETVCKNASTVMEFIENAKREIVTNQSNIAGFEDFLKTIDLSFEEYNSYPRGKQAEIVNDYLESNMDLLQQVNESVAKEYHNGVLRSIMIRQPNTVLQSKQKNVVNYLFFKTPNTYEPKIKFTLNKVEGVLDIDHFNDDKAVEYDGDFYSIEGITKEMREVTYNNYIHYSDVCASLFRQAVTSIDNVDEVKNKNPFFVKKNSLNYYEQLMHARNNNVKYKLKVLTTSTDDIFDHKYELFEELCNIHSNERIIVFFDYDLKKKDRVVEKFIETVKKSKLKSRFINGCAATKVESQKEFNEKEDALLVVTDPSFTESVNLQKSSIIINFQIICDPVSMDQRIGRVFRLGQQKDITIYNLADMDKLEGYSLMYLSSIGLLTTNSGDATILAGSNSEKMIAIRCKRCQKVELISESDYEYRKAHNQLMCDTVSCISYKEELDRIVVTDFKCDKCGRPLIRGENGYECWSSTAFGYPKDVYHNSGKANDRSYKCSKRCAMLNCQKLQERDCAAVRMLKENINAGLELLQACLTCPFAKVCDPSCRPASEDISKCHKCQFAGCELKPHSIDFDQNWEAKCPDPTCRGTLKPMVASSFAQYVKSSWDFKQDGGLSFCRNLIKEQKKVAQIRTILEMDNLGEE